MADQNQTSAVKTHEFVFLLSEMFSMMPFAAALEPLRLANRMSRRPLYSWRLVSETGAPATASNGVVVPRPSDTSTPSRRTCPG